MRTRQRPLDLLNGLSVPVYRMADQEFCELKVDFELRHPEIEHEIRRLPKASAQLESIDSGKEFHETVAAPAEAISADDIQQLVSSRQPFTLIETSLFGRYRSLPMIGRPDALHFDGRGSAWVVEHKVRARPYLTPSDDAQLRLYGFLLRQDRRFDVRRLSLVCVITSREAAAKIATLPEQRRAGLAQLVSKPPPGPSESRRRWDEHRVRGLGTDRLRAAIFDFDEAKAQDELRFLSRYWLGTRQPMPTRKPQKCSVCRVNALRLCPVAQVGFGDYVGRRAR